MKIEEKILWRGGVKKKEDTATTLSFGLWYGIRMGPIWLVPHWFRDRAQNSKLWPCLFFLTPCIFDDGPVFSDSSIFDGLWRPKLVFLDHFFWRKSFFGPFDPSVIHGWKDTDLLFMMVQRKNYLSHTVKRQIFDDAPGQTFYMTWDCVLRRIWFWMITFDCMCNAAAPYSCSSPPVPFILPWIWQ